MLRKVPEIYVHTFTHEGETHYYLASSARNPNRQHVGSANGAAFEWAKANPDIPAFIGTAVRGRRYWSYGGAMYVTTERLTPDDVVALVHESENRVKLKLQRARALQAMAAQTAAPRRDGIPREVKLFVWQRDHGCCVACGSNRDLEFDHVIPLSLGGSSTERNLQLLCADCNRRKGATLGGEGT
jgi:5-methylcytosine-specific restriction endonuclease McrA